MSVDSAKNKFFSPKIYMNLHCYYNSIQGCKVKLICLSEYLLYPTAHIMVHTSQSPSSSTNTTISKIFPVISSTQIKVPLGKGRKLNTDSMNHSFLAKTNPHTLSIFT